MTLPELPAGWEWAESAEACESVRDGTHDTPKYVEIGIPLVTSKHLREGAIDFTTTKRISPEEHLEISKRSAVEAGDILYAMIGTIGNPVVVKPGAEFSIKNVALFKKQEAVLMPEFHGAWLRSPTYERWLFPRLKGTSQRFAPLGLLRSSPVPIPPLKEQRRIVAKIESLFERSRRAKESLDAIPPLLDKLRQSILAAAFRGDLTADWRAQNPNVEPADKLLERIRTERRHRWEQTELAKIRAKGKEPRDDKWKAKYKDGEFSTEDLPELPEGWCWTRIDECCEEVFLGLTSKVDYVESGGVPLVRAGDFSKGTLSFIKARNISERQHQDLTKYRKAKQGDVLVSKSGSLGAAAPVLVDTEFSIYESVICMRPMKPHLQQDYLLWMIRSPEVRVRMLGRRVGSTVGHLNLKEFRTLRVPVPPPDEQQALVLLLNQAMSAVGELEKQSAAAAKALPTCNASILAKAFRGELVVQDPNDEPASVFLERIRIAREAAKPVKKKKAKRRVGGKKNAEVSG